MSISILSNKMNSRMKVGIHKALEPSQVGSFEEVPIFSRKSLFHTYYEASSELGIGHL